MNGSLEKSLTGPKEVQLAFGKRTTVQREWHLCLLIQSQFLLQEKNTSLLFSGSTAALATAWLWGRIPQAKC